MRETNPTRPRQETKIEECHCENCGKSFQGEVTTYFFVVPPKIVTPKECPECRQTREAEEGKAEEKELNLKSIAVREKWKAICGIPRAFQGMTFDDLDPDYQLKAQRICRKWAMQFDLNMPGASQSLLLYSPGPGVGKTVLMSVVATYIIDNWSGDPDNDICPIRFESGPGLVRRIRATYNLPEGVFHEREEDIYRELKGVKLLMLDDVGKEQPRSYRFTQEVYWYVIDERVKAGLPVMINSRLPLLGEGSLEEVMGGDTVNRIYGMCGGKVVEIKGTSYRILKKIP